MRHTTVTQICDLCGKDCGGSWSRLSRRIGWWVICWMQEVDTCMECRASFEEWRDSRKPSKKETRNAD